MKPAESCADALIIGAGAIGLWISVKLAQRGARVVVLDRDTPGSGAFFGNAGLLTPSLALPLARPGAVRQALKWTLSRTRPFAIQPSLDPLLVAWLIRFARSGRQSMFEQNTRAMVQLCLANMIDWKELDQTSCLGGIDFNNKGLLVLFESAGLYDHGLRLAEPTERCGIHWESWDEDRLRSEEPVVSDQISGEPPSLGHTPFAPHDSLYCATQTQQNNLQHTD